jgi:hypothetical protein
MDRSFSHIFGTLCISGRNIFHHLLTVKDGRSVRLKSRPERRLCWLRLFTVLYDPSMKVLRQYLHSFLFIVLQSLHIILILIGDGETNHKININVIVQSSVFCNITPYSPLNVNRRFVETCDLHVQGRKISRTRNKREAGSKQMLSNPHNLWF